MMLYRPILIAAIILQIVVGVRKPALADDSKDSTDKLNAEQQAVQELEQGVKPSELIRDEPANLRVEDMTMDELKRRLTEFEAGKRDDRDGIIIADQLWFNYGGRKERDTLEAQHTFRIREALLKMHPDFVNLGDNRLSDKIQFEARQSKQHARLKTELSARAKKWVPKDSIPRKYGS